MNVACAPRAVYRVRQKRFFLGCVITHYAQWGITGGACTSRAHFTGRTGGNLRAANVTGTCQEVDSLLCFFGNHSDGRRTNSSLSVTNPKLGPFFTVAAASVSLFSPPSLNRIVTT